MTSTTLSLDYHYGDNSITVVSVADLPPAPNSVRVTNSYGDYVILGYASIDGTTLKGLTILGGNGYRTFKANLSIVRAYREFTSMEDVSKALTEVIENGGGGGGASSFSELSGSPYDNTALRNALEIKVDKTSNNEKPFTIGCDVNGINIVEDSIKKYIITEDKVLSNLSPTSSNPVASSVIYTALENKVKDNHLVKNGTILIDDVQTMVYDDSEIRDVVAGLSKSYVIQDKTAITGTEDAETNIWTNVTAITGITLANVKVGDNIFLRDPTVPDYWVSAKTTANVLTLDPLDGKTNLDNYYTKIETDDLLDDKVDKTQKVAGIDLQDDITVDEMKDVLSGQIVTDDDGFPTGDAVKTYVDDKPTILTGTGEPTADIGKDGDIYIQTGVLYEEPVTDVQVNGVSVVDDGVASINAVTDVQVDGVSVVEDGIAKIDGGGSLPSFEGNAGKVLTVAPNELSAIWGDNDLYLNVFTFEGTDSSMDDVRINLTLFILDTIDYETFGPELSMRFDRIREIYGTGTPLFAMGSMTSLQDEMPGSVYSVSVIGEDALPMLYIDYFNHAREERKEGQFEQYIFNYSGGKSIKLR